MRSRGAATADIDAKSGRIRTNGNAANAGQQ